MVKYVYDSELSPLMVEYIEMSMRDYPNVVELKTYPDEGWINANLPLYPRKNGPTNLYCWLSKDLDGKPGGFFFVKTAAEKQLIVNRLPDLVENANPFKTAFG